MLIFSFLICVQHSFSFIETAGFLVQSELFITLTEGCGTGSVGQGEAWGSHQRPLGEKVLPKGQVKKCRAGAKLVWG